MKSHCPHCSRTISAAEQDYGVCPHCGQQFDRPVSTGFETVVDVVPIVTPSEGDDAGRPVDSVEPSLPPPDEARKTLQAGASAQTLGSGEFLDVEAAERASRATHDVRPGRSTMASDDTAAGDDPNKTVVAGHGLPTVEQDFIELSDEPLTDHPTDTGRIAQTLDSIDFPQDVPVLDDPRRTVAENRLAQTLDSDSVGESGVPLPWLTGDVPPIARTVDSVDIPMPPGPGEASRTVDDSHAHQTMDVPSAPVLPGQGTLAEGTTLPTIEIPMTDEPSAVNDSSVIDERVNQTLDSVDMPRPVPEGRGTVHDQRLDATIDSIFLGTQADEAEHRRLEHTLDSISGMPGPSRAERATVDVPVPGSVDDAKPGTIDDRSKATFDSQDLGTAAKPPRGKGGTIPDRNLNVTYDSAELTSRDAKDVDQMWRGVNVEKASPRMTIKGRDERPQDTKTSLVIQRRHFREVRPTDPIEGSTADYDLLKMLGQGGMGVVYAARQASIDRTVAVKMLKPEMSRDVGQRSKFLAEAVITGDLDHPNIVPIYDLGKNPQGALFYAMKKVQGTPWDKVLSRKSLVENLDILQKVADAVAFAHNRNVVHRDLKPENIMLGDFGEVLVMDWGLALPFGTFEKSRSIQPSVSMGGTPAYMAPEMATGPFDRIGPTSDIYLLGAILYEIVTGRPPHTGRDVMKCLFAAAKNEIQPSEKSGELVNIALKAMATRQSDRYQTVQEFQSAIREYEAHSSSIAMVVRAEEALGEAQSSQQYETFARSVFEFQEALTLWSGNAKAADGFSRGKLAYARCALDKGDLDLAESLLDAADPRHAEALTQVAAAKQEREARQQRLKANRRLIRSLVTACVLLLATGLASVSYQTQQVRKQRDLAQKNADEATRQKTQAEEQRERAEKGEQEAIAQKQIAERQTALAERQTQVAQNESEAAKRAREAAIRAQAEEAKQRELADQNAQKARDAETVALAERDNANYEKYVALIGLAAAKIEENAFGYARELLQQCPPALRNWEWGRLMYLCEQSVQVVEAGTPINAVAFSADGRHFATGGWNGLAQVFQAHDGQRVSTMQHTGPYVNAVAYCPTRPEIATGSSGSGQNLQIWQAATGQLVRTLVGHTDDVLSAVYSRDGQRLLTASRDNTARLWNCETGELIHTYEGHTWWVWAAAFSRDERRVVTASQDGTALVWSLDGRQRSAPFMGHQGPVFAAAFAPDGERIATGGHDKRVLVWKAADIAPFDYETLLQGGRVPVPRAQEMLGHLGAVRSVAFSGDGKLILSGGHDNVVRVWNAESGNLVKTLRGHDEWVQSCAFSPDNRLALSGSRDGAARLWDIQGYEEARVLQGRWLRGHEDAVMAVAFSPRDDQIVTASRDRTARTWDTRTGRPHTSFDEGHFFLASHAAFYPGHKRLATSAGDNTTRVWDVETGGQLLLLEGTGRAAAVAIANSGRWIATGGGTSEGGAWIAQLWDAGSGERKRVLGGHAGQVTAVAFSPDDQFLYTGDSHGGGTLWRTDSGVAVARLDWHTSKVAAAEFLRDGQRLLTASDDKTVAQWDTSELSRHPDRVMPLTQLTLKHDESVLALDVSDNQKLAITSTTGGQVQVWDLGRAVPVRSLPAGTSEVNTVELSSDGRRALTAHPGENCVRLWDVVSSREIQGFASQPGSQPPLLDLNRLGGSVWSARFVAGADRILTVGGNQALLWDLRAETPHREPLMRFSPHAAVVSVDYSPDGKLLVTGSWDNSARIWDVASGKDIQQLVGAHTGTVNCATFSPDGQFVLTTSDDKTARLWDRSTGQVVRAFVGHAGPVRFGLFSARGDRILTTSDDKTARLWDTASGRELQEFKSHEWGVLCAAFSADGTRIITGSADSSARIWDAATGQVLLTLSGHTASVTSVAFAPDGQRVLTASDDFTAKLWDSQTGKEILSLKGHSQELTSVAFSHDGQYALTGSQDGTAILWLTRGWKPPAVATAPSRSRARGYPLHSGVP